MTRSSKTINNNKSYKNKIVTQFYYNFIENIVNTFIQYYLNKYQLFNFNYVTMIDSDKKFVDNMREKLHLKISYTLIYIDIKK